MINIEQARKRVYNADKSVQRIVGEALERHRSLAEELDRERAELAKQEYHDLKKSVEQVFDRLHSVLRRALSDRWGEELDDVLSDWRVRAVGEAWDRLLSYRDVGISDSVRGAILDVLRHAGMTVEQLPESVRREIDNIIHDAHSLDSFYADYARKLGDIVMDLVWRLYNPIANEICDRIDNTFTGLHPNEDDVDAAIWRIASFVCTQVEYIVNEYVLPYVQSHMADDHALEDSLYVLHDELDVRLDAEVSQIVFELESIAPAQD